MNDRLLQTKLGEWTFWYRSDDKYVGQRIALGKYEEYESMLMRQQMKNAGVVVDVGANIGYYTLMMARLAKMVYAIEPDRDCFEILKKNVEANKLKNVVLLNIAIGAKKEKLTLVKDKENQGNSHIGSGKGSITTCERLDQILLNEQKIDLIKIDTQGWEPQVIEGAQKIINRDRPTLFLEYSPSEYSNNQMIDYLSEKYKNIWSIDFWFYVCRHGVYVNKQTGYVDLWIKNKMRISDYWWTIKEIRVKKLLKWIATSLGMLQ